MPAVNRFPSAAQGAGFRPLADSVHAMGLKFGIHIIRGIPREAVARNLPIAGSPYHAADAADRSDTCAWNPDNYGLKPNAAGQAYYDSIAKLYASWGVDYVKVDCISQPYKKDEIHMMSAALKKTGRPIVLSLSPGPTPLADAADVRTVAQMWRISNDVWDNWTRAAGGKWSPQTVLEQFPLTAAWAPYAGPGHWPDADMLPVGYLGPVPGWGQARSTRLTQDEQRTLLSLWSIFRSPLMIGANLTRSDAFTASLFTNPEVLAVDQHSTGNHPVVQSAKTVVWTAAAEDGRGHYLAVFNLADSPRTVNYPWQALGLKPGKYRVRDLWERKDLGDESGLRVDLRPHASVLYRVAP
jgi:alpha-galactosidase